MAGPFKMSGTKFYGHGNQKRKDGMPYAEYAQMAGAALGAMSKKDDDKGSEEPVGLDKENMPKSGAKYASPAKVDEKKKTEEKVEVNEFGETPEQYKQRMIDMGLRKSDAKEEIDEKEAKKASKRDREAAGQ